MAYKQFEKKWLGKRVDTDSVPKGQYYQCVDLAKQYMKEIAGVPYGAYGDAIHYWTRTHKNVLAKFDKVRGSVKEGDLVVLSGGRYGHIGIATGKTNAISVEILEQNGHGTGTGLGKDAIRKRSILKIRIAGLLRLKGTSSKKYYTVKQGDTVTKISKDNGISIDTFKKLNPSIKNINKISIGQKVRVR